MLGGRVKTDDARADNGGDDATNFSHHCGGVVGGLASVRPALAERKIAVVVAVALIVGFGSSAGAAPQWSVVRSPNPAGQTSLLNGVSCASATSCVAVGSSNVQNTTSNTTKSLVERWNGTRWSIVASPNAAGTYNSLNAVSCTSPTNCTAVGSSDTEGKALVERWNGTRWSIVPAPSPTGGQLDGVSCTSAAFCLAVGAYYPSARTMFAERWDGKHWSVVPNPSNGSDNSQLLGVSCTSPRNCTAVGDYHFPTTGNHSLVERWNGTNLSIVPSPNHTGGGFLAGVSCANAKRCAAVGRYGASVDKTLVERWNGTRWSIVSSPSPSTAASFLENVSCANGTTCTAVGVQYPTQKTNKTLIERWDGNRWSVAPSPTPTDADPNAGPDGPWLDGVSCTKTNRCVTVGHYQSASSGHTKTLVERSSG